MWLANGHMQMFRRFQECFGASLNKYWIDSVNGLNVDKFATEVVKHRAGPRGLVGAIRSKFGGEGVTIFKRLTPKTKK